jgi:serine/threonine protein kinase
MSLSLYPIIKELGDGGFGKTYLATNTLLPSRPYCVLKQLKPVASDPQLQQLIRDRFEKEGAILESLGNSSNGKIPRLYAYFVEQGEFYLIQEYVDGQTLTERVKTHGLFTEREVKDLLINILPTLAYVHSKGIVHRDIKPDNIMLRRDDNTPILIDFGAVKETMGTTVTASGNSARSIVIGTPGFMPVEQISGRPMYASDIYALGLTAIYVLTGRIPSDIETDPSTGNIDWQPLARGVSPQLIGVIDKAIQPSSRDRYPSANEMLAALAPTPQTPPPTQQVIAPPPTPTVVVSPPPANSQQQTVYVPPEQQYQPQPTNLDRSNSPNPLLIAMLGVLVGGVLIALGLVLGRNFTNSTSPVTTKPSSIPATTTTNSESTSSPTAASNTPNTPTPATTSTPTATPSTQIASQSPVPSQSPTVDANSPAANPIALTQTDASNLIVQWMEAKKSVFGSSYLKSVGEDLTTGLAYERNINATPGTEPSSVDDLVSNGLYYTYSNQQLHQIVDIQPIGDNEVKVKAIVSEQRTLHNIQTGRTKDSSTFRSKSCYQFKKIGNRWKISKTPELFASCS